MRIKIRTALCMGLLLAICLTGCGTGYSVEKDYIIPVLDALEEGDAETIYDMFAPDVKKAETFLQEDAETLAGMYEGELVTYRIVDGSTSDRGKKSGYRKKNSLQHAKSERPKESICSVLPPVLKERPRLTLPMAKARGFLLHPSLHLRSEERRRLT